VTGRPQRRPRLLVVDDEPQLLELLSLTLHLAGFGVTPASSGPLALDLARQTIFDLIVLDLLMTPWNGLDTARQLRALPGRCPPIIFLGEPCPEALPCLSKPFQTTQLTQLVESTLRPAP
jgi:two-component system, OmpR family, response regulator